MTWLPSPHVTMFSQWMIALSPTHWARSPLTPLLTLPPPPPPVHLFFPSPCCQSPAIPSKEYTSYCDDPVCLHPGKKKTKKTTTQKTAAVKQHRLCDTPLTCLCLTDEEKKRLVFCMVPVKCVSNVKTPVDWTRTKQESKVVLWCSNIPPVRLLSRKLHWMFWLKTLCECCWFQSYGFAEQWRDVLILFTFEHKQNKDFTHSHYFLLWNLSRVMWI